MSIYFQKEIFFIALTYNPKINIRIPPRNAAAATKRPQDAGESFRSFKFVADTNPKAIYAIPSKVSVFEVFKSILNNII